MTDNQFSHVMLYLNIIGMLLAKDHYAIFIFMALGFYWLMFSGRITYIEFKNYLKLKKRYPNFKLKGK